MADYPDPDEEFELMYGDELDLLREQEEDSSTSVLKSRRSLNFSSPSTSTTNTVAQTKDSETFLNDSFDELSALAEKDLQLPNSLLPELTQRSVAPEEGHNSKKRSIEDLFGDIDDLLFEDQVNPKRKKRDKEAEDLALIEQIVELRKKAREKQALSAVVCLTTNNDIERNKRNVSYQIPKYPFIGFRGRDGDRVYVRFHSEDYEKEETQRLVKECSFNGVMGESFKKTWEEAREIVNKELDKRNNCDRDDIREENEVADDAQLWVDLYKPRKYLELLSDESTNRTMLKWMKLWDKVVFGRKPKVREHKEDPNKKNYFKKTELRTKLDEYGRPEHKVALLCGPPGLGKTTLAHMVARQAGYNVVEVNASDDRSTDSFKTALENATQMRSVVDNMGRPNCLVFDEIDGAPQSSIDFLIKFVNGTVGSKPKKAKDNKKAAILKRPIICICNDVYVAALRPLRQIAFVVNFPQTSGARLAERLMEIARRQGIRTDLGAMMALAEKSNNDIRSCLSVLQFQKARNKAVTLSEVHRSHVGQKDMQKGLFSVWNDIFQIERPKAKPGEAGGLRAPTPRERVSQVLRTVSAFGDYDRLCQGVFENYACATAKDPTLEAAGDALRWFAFFDRVSAKIHATQNYALNCYLQYAFAAWHLAFAGHQRPKVQYPGQGYEAKAAAARRRAVADALLAGLPADGRSQLGRLQLLLDACPYLARVTAPAGRFRPVSAHLYTRDERAALLRVAAVMAAYGLDYVQERAPDGAYVYALDPDVVQLTTFGGERPAAVLPYPVKQLLSREVEAEKMRRSRGAEGAGGGGRKAAEAPAAAASAAPAAALPNHLQTLRVKNVRKAEPVIRRDFFGRVIESPTSANGGQASGGAAGRQDVWYQYKEGYNNAVRKPVRVAALK